MAGTGWLNTAYIKQQIEQGSRSALEEVGDRLAADARRRAPIRKVFKEKKGYRRRFRMLTAAEKRIATARSIDYYTNISLHPNRQHKMAKSVAHIRNYARAASPGKGSLNALNRSNKLRTLGYERHGAFIPGQPGVVRLSGRRTGRFEVGKALGDRLTSAGKYEIESGRAIHREPTASGHVRVRAGGALKASIDSEGVTETPSGQKVVVSAAIRYAKFVEFPTVHNAAQPFLRPALHAMRAEFPGIVRSHIQRALRG